ncbi:hypothetical protein [Pseudonocardia zijingensis]|jgi:hypothetical protein|uniref:Integral membrane protein n=1 Tax=Pseudonocardia zijingensis TaxID=153376 RepID=A0ABN1PE34_9PSEU
MKSVYRVLAYLVALEVVVQAAAIAFAVAGLGAWISQGGVLDAAAMESESTEFTGVAGFMVHGINGQMILPLIALLLLLSSFFAGIPGGVLWAGLVLLTVVVQVLLGIFGHGAPVLGLLHGAVALVLFSLAVVAARRSETALRAADDVVAPGTAGVA